MSRTKRECIFGTKTASAMRSNPIYPAPTRSATFPTTATAVGVRRIYGKLECCAPFGLDDLFGLLVKPNKRQITRAVYEAKVDRWRPIWPRLTYLPWEEAIPGQ